MAQIARVLMMIDGLRVGGAERVTVALTRGLRARGIDVRLAHLGLEEGGPLAAELEATGTPVLNLRVGTLFDPRPVLRLAAYLWRARIDLVHTHNRYAHLIGRPAAALACRPVVSTIHMSGEEEFGRRATIRRRLDFWTARTLCAAVITVSDAQRKGYLSAAGVDRARVETHFNGIDTEAFSPSASARRRVRAELGAGRDTLLFASVTMLRPGKGIEYLLKASALLAHTVPQARFVIIGDGVERASLERLSNSLGQSPGVRFLGLRTDIADILAAADVHVTPSLAEALPTSVLEAMAVQVPVVATAVGGTPEIVQHDRTGLLVPPADAQALAAAMTRLVDPDLRHALGAAGRVWVEARASERVWVDSMLRVYERVIHRKSR